MSGFRVSATCMAEAAQGMTLARKYMFRGYRLEQPHPVDPFKVQGSRVGSLPRVYMVVDQNFFSQKATTI